MITDRWAAGDAYEAYMGRWSRPLARAFVGWLRPPRGAAWLDIGCGTGALTRAICELAEPKTVVACDPSEPFVEHARSALPDGRVAFAVSGVDALPADAQGFDCIVSGLVANFFAEPLEAVRRMIERLRPGGVVGTYVWDYAEGMELLRVFWDEAVALDAAAAALDEARRFPLCDPQALDSLFRRAGLEEVSVESLEIATAFPSFDDYWRPFLGGTGPAPSYAASLSRERQERLRERLLERLPPDKDGWIRLKARAWAARGASTPARRARQ